RLEREKVRENLQVDGTAIETAKAAGPWPDGFFAKREKRKKRKEKNEKTLVQFALPCSLPASIE
ncbi:MAG: hypothetical protein LUE89_05055, partial [Clostridiales bacterium]|nr:hypothetical protein [Clostridiales bacterium]